MSGRVRVEDVERDGKGKGEGRGEAEEDGGDVGEDDSASGWA